MALISGMDDVINYIKKQDKEIKELKEENKKLTFDDAMMEKQVDDFCLQVGKLKEENEKLHERVTQVDKGNTKEYSSNLLELVLQEDNTNLTRRRDELLEENKELKEELFDTTMKSNAKSEIILNLFDLIIKDTDIDDGFDIGREWGNKSLDLWNKIVTEELKSAVEKINEYENGDDVTSDRLVLETNGYHFNWTQIDDGAGTGR
jgi:FtsZ-binding cell division protein ZapB